MGFEEGGNGLRGTWFKSSGSEHNLKALPVCLRSSMTRSLVFSCWYSLSNDSALFGEKWNRSESKDTDVH